MDRVRLDIPIDTLRVVKHAAKTALMKHLHKSREERNEHRRKSNGLSARHLATFLDAIEEQVGDIHIRKWKSDRQ